MKHIITALLLFVAFTIQAQDSTYRIAYPPVRITIDIPDLVVNGTTIKQRAQLFTMTLNQKAEQLVLSWVVKSYADSAGLYGQSLESIVPNYSKESIADNYTFVNPATGAILLPDSTGKYEMNYMGQYDWFNMIGENQPILVHQMLRQYGLLVPNWGK